MKYHLLSVQVFCVCFLVVILSSCEQDKKEYFALNHILTCNAELVENNHLVTSDDTLFCNGAKHQTTKFSHSGNNSILSSKINKYTMTVEISDIVVDGHYRAEIWRYGDNKEGKLVVEGDHFWQSSNVAHEVEPSGWEKLVLDFYVPPTATKKSLKLFFWNSGEQEIFVDDLKLEFLDKPFPEYEEEYLRIEIEDIDKINELRKQAFEDKMLITTKKSYVKAVIHFGNQEMPAKVRLKGDWLDHIKGKKWSFRIKLEKGYSWRGMRTFNIQTPEARGFLEEWVAHKIAEKEDVLTTRYEFIPVKINGENLGIYAYEEHFEKQLVENKQRREGPIIKFSEDHLWRARREKINDFPFFESAPIVPFKKNKTMKSANLKNQFEQAKNQLNAFRNCSASCKDIFDVDKMAKFLAFTDLTRGQHGLIWHNLRFYFNPVLFKLEPVAYDLKSNDEFSYLNRTLIGNFDPKKVNEEFGTMNSFYHLFEDSVFTSQYISYLEKFSDKEYINSFFSVLDTSLSQAELLVYKEFDNYSYDRNFLLNQQIRIQEKLPEMKRKFKQNYSSVLKSKLPKSKSIEAPEIPIKLIPFNLHVYRSEDKYELISYFPNDFKILGYLDENKEGVLWQKPMEIKKYSASSGYYSLNLGVGFNKKKVKLIISKNNIQDTIKVELFPWEKPKEITQKSLEENIPDWMHRDGKKIVVNQGNYMAKSLIVIPAGYEVFIEEDTKITFIDGSGLWSESPVFFEGKESKHITIIGRRNIGFTVLNTEKKSVLKYVDFIKLGTFKKGNWQLTGAVNFYEADVDLFGCEFRDNRCEDALNIVRSDFKVTGCSFYTIFSDAFDSDFSEGVLSKTKFVGVSNDAIDFSGSNVLIQDCTIQAAKDKGISGGENSRLTIENCTISGCKIAVASKDQSLVKVEKTNITNCEYGFVAFQKKPEYGPATIVADSSVIENVQYKTFIEEFSKFILNGKSVAGTEKNVATIFY